MELNLIQSAIQKRQETGLPIVNLSFADFTFYGSLLTRNNIQKAFINIFKYPYYYPTAKGELEARQAISRYYRTLGQEVDPESLLITSSINQSYLYLLKIFSAEGGEILASSPHTPALDEVAGILDCQIATFPLNEKDGWQIDLDQLEKSINKNTKAIFLMSPHLPTGAIQKEETISRLAKMIKGKSIALVVDESFSDFIFNHAKLPVIPEIVGRDQLVISLQGLANSFALPGFKISWIQASGPDDQAQAFLQTLELLGDTFLNLNQLAQTVLPEVIKFSRRWRKKFQKTVERNRDILVSKLSKSPRLKFHFPEGGFYAFIEILDEQGKTQTGEDLDQKFVVELLEKTGVYLHPGHYYGKKSPCYAMICFLQEPRILRNSLKKIVKFLKPPKSARKESSSAKPSTIDKTKVK